MTDDPTTYLLAHLHTAFTVMGITVFLGILAWAYAPKRRRALEQASRIPLEDDR